MVVNILVGEACLLISLSPLVIQKQIVSVFLFICYNNLMNIEELTKKTKQVSDAYAKSQGIKVDDDYFVFKLQEELGELTQKYLMLTDRGRQKDKTKDEIRKDFEMEVADVFGLTLLLSKHFKIDLEKAMEEKWFVWLEK